MTKAAKHYGKRLDNFFTGKEAREYIAEFGKLTGNTGSIELIQTRHGRYGSTWAHPKLAVFFARWLDVRFAVWCDLTLDEILRGRVEVKAVPSGVPPLSPPRPPETRHCGDYAADCLARAGDKRSLGIDIVFSSIIARAINPHS